MCMHTHLNKKKGKKKESEEARRQRIKRTFSKILFNLIRHTFTNIINIKLCKNKHLRTHSTDALWNWLLSHGITTRQLTSYEQGDRIRPKDNWFNIQGTSALIRKTELS